MDDPFILFTVTVLMLGLGIIGVLGYLAALVGITWWIDQKLPARYPDWAAPAILFAVWGAPAVFLLPFDFTNAALSIGISAAMGLLTWWLLMKLKRKAALATED